MSKRKKEKERKFQRTGRAFLNSPRSGMSGSVVAWSIQVLQRGARKPRLDGDFIIKGCGESCVDLSLYTDASPRGAISKLRTLAKHAAAAADAIEAGYEALEAPQ